MERNIEINGHGHLIKWEWVIDGMSLIFQGEAINSEMNKTVSAIEFRFPFGFQRKYGTASMENDIIAEVKVYLEQKT